MDLYAAHVIREGEGFLFLSPDDDHYLEVNLPRLPPDLDEEGAEHLREQVVNLIAGKSPDGEPRQTKPMTFARRYFSQTAVDKKASDVTLFRWEDGEWIVTRDYKFQGAVT